MPLGGGQAHHVAASECSLHLLEDVLEVPGAQGSGHLDQSAPPHVSNVPGAMLQCVAHLQ